MSCSPRKHSGKKVRNKGKFVNFVRILKINDDLIQTEEEVIFDAFQVPINVKFGVYI